MPRAVKVTIVELKEPCSACLITGNLIKEMLGSICSEYSYAAMESIVLQDLKDVHDIDGLEVEKFPALLINNEQISAGSLLMKGELLSLIKSEGEDDE